MLVENGVTPEATTPTGATPNPQPAAPTQPAPASATPATSPDTAAIIRDLETRLASANAHVETLKSENIERRKAAKVADEDREALAKFRAISETPDALTAQLEAGKAAINERDALSREKAQNDAAKATGLKPSAFSAKWLGDGLPVVETEGEGDAAAQKVYVQTGDVKTPWDDFVKANPELADVLPALKADGAHQAPGTPHVRQNPGGQGNNKPAIDEEAARRSQERLYSSF